MSRVLPSLVTVVLSTAAWVMENDLPFAGRADVIRILGAGRFEVLRDVKKIPDEDLRSAGVIPRSRRLSSALINPDQPFDPSDAFVDAIQDGPADPRGDKQAL